MLIKEIELFVKNRVGRLMKLDENELTRFQFEIWFEYTRQAMVQLKEGTLVTARNFSSNNDETHYSVLEIISLKPIHYALGEDISGYPGFVMEAARNISSDWLTQEEVSQEDTTIIKCVAAPTGLEIVEDNDGRIINNESNIPMIGSEIRVLTNECTELIINREISVEDDIIFEGGKWLVDKEIPIYIRQEEFIRLHFGIFGFTGSGKSNLVSSYISNILHKSIEKNYHTKIVLFDLMSEYSVLLSDYLEIVDDAYLLALGEKTYPKSVIDYLSGKSSKLEKAADDFQKTSLYPTSLKGYKQEFRTLFKSLLEKNKIIIYQETDYNFSKFLNENKSTLTIGRVGNALLFLESFIDKMYSSFGNNTITKEACEIIFSEIDRVQVVAERKKKKTEGANLQQMLQKSEPVKLLDEELIPKEISQTVTTNLINFKRILRTELTKEKISYSENRTLSKNDLMSLLNSEKRSCLIIIQSHDPDDLRDFAYKLGLELYEHRRQEGTIIPLVSFIFDEADEFIKQNPLKESSYSRSAFIAEMLARRGRKFGIGIGICTQRTRYLATSVMAQPHTYLVSKMPRKSDRDAVQEAFGFSDEMFRQTFKFNPGNWLLASYDATGMKGVPIPIQTDNANERIINYLKKKTREKTVEE